MLLLLLLLLWEPCLRRVLLLVMLPLLVWLPGVPRTVKQRLQGHL
jgi:hypothetical protein